MSRDTDVAVLLKKIPIKKDGSFQRRALNFEREESVSCLRLPVRLGRCSTVCRCVILVIRRRIRVEWDLLSSLNTSMGVITAAASNALAPSYSPPSTVSLEDIKSRRTYRNVFGTLRVLQVSEYHASSQ